MPAIQINPFESFNDLCGKPLNCGFVYIGEPNLDPKDHPIDIFYNDGLTQQAVQPLRTTGGYITNGCAPTNIYSASEDYSIRVLDKHERLVFYIPSWLARHPVKSLDDSKVIVQQPFANAVLRTQHDKNKEFVTVMDFGAKGDGVTDDTTAINNAILAVQAAGGGYVYMPAGLYRTTAQITVKTNVTVIGSGRGATIVRLSVYDQVFVLEANSTLRDVTADANDMSVGSATKLAVISIAGDYCFIDNVEAMRGYSGIATSTNYSTITNIFTHDHESRGLIIDPFGSYNLCQNIHSYNNHNAGILIGHGAHHNTVNGFEIRNISLASIWIHQGAHNNMVSNGIIATPADPTKCAVTFGSSVYNNIVSGVNISGYERVVQFVGDPIDGAYPEITSRDTSGNIFENCICVGTDKTLSNSIAVSFQQTDPVGPIAPNNTVRNCSFREFYGVFSNASDAANNTSLENIRIRTETIGAGTIIQGMKSNGTDIIKISRVEGFGNQTRYLSSTFSIDSTGTKTVVIVHGLPYTPSLTALQPILYRETVVEDFRVDRMWAVAVSSTDITVRIQVGMASASAGAVARVILNLDMQAENGFPTSALT